MIKTVSFAPPRASGSRSGAKAAGVKTMPAEALRPNTRPASGRTKAKAPAQTSLELLFDEPEVPVAAPVVVSPVVATPAPKPAKKVALAPKGAPAPTELEVAQIEAPARAVRKAPTEVKAKRARVPKDLAAQYGEKAVARVAPPPVEAEIARKRLSKDERQARRELIKPSDDLLERLARLNQIGARKPKGEPRGKGWKFVCGRCGGTSYFETPGGLCACGTIAVKE